jgi:predicted amidohydrolase
VPKSSLCVALMQTSSIPGDVAANARAAERAIASAAERGARLVVFPELFLTGYELAFITERKSSWIESENDPRLDPIRNACRASNVTAIVGAPFRDPEGHGYITAPIVGSDGSTRLWFKEHIHGSESALFRPGAQGTPFEVGDWRVAIGICFDTAHPRHAERARQSGADLYAVSALYFRGEVRRCDLHLGARAMDNRMFSVLANYEGRTGEYESCGLSGAWSPSGEVIARVQGTGEAMLVVDLDPDQLARFRG